MWNRIFNSRRRRSCLGFLLLGVVAVSALQAEPYRPDSDDQVMESLSVSTDGQDQRIKERRRALEAAPQRLDLAVALARDYLTRYQRQGDARDLGYAEAVVSPWLEQSDPPPAALLIRAHLRQSRHAFDEALADLDRVLSRDPRRPQAWLMRATIATVQADYDKARDSCGRLLMLSDPLVVATCLASVNSLGADPDAAYRLITRALDTNPEAAASTRLWALTVAGEIAARRGEADVAEAHFQSAMAADTPDIYLLNAYADLLLAQDRPRAAFELLEDRPLADGVLLRRALAASRLDLAQAPDLSERLARRFEATRARGDQVHRREAGRYALELADEPEHALELARANWRQQREPADARLLMEAALAAGKPAAARPALDWFRDHPVDVRLMRLARRLEGEAV